MKIYVAGPYSRPDPVLNTHMALVAAEELIKKGHTPYVPHLTLLWHIVFPHPVEFWYDYDYIWLRFCNAVLRLPGVSTGADMEVKIARQICIPVYYSLDEVPEGVENGPE
jgi:hypothetical protein